MSCLFIDKRNHINLTHNVSGLRFEDTVYIAWKKSRAHEFKQQEVALDSFQRNLDTSILPEFWKISRFS